MEYVSNNVMYMVIVNCILVLMMIHNVVVMKDIPYMKNILLQ
jgi:hypothetical protein